MSLLAKIKEHFVEECKLRNLPLGDHGFADFFINLLARDGVDGLNPHKIGECTVQSFFDGALRRYANPLDPTVINLRVTYSFAQARELQMDYVQLKYEENFRSKLQRLIDDILQYPETSNSTQLDEMCMKMQVFIVANYNLGCPKNHVLLKATQQSLNSVIGRGELHNYVLKKKYHRLEYLQRLSATVCGILVNNNHGPDGEKENMRDIVADLEMAQRNTKTSLDEALQRTADYKTRGYKTMMLAAQLKFEDAFFYIYCAMSKLRELSAFIALFTVYERCLKEISKAFEKTVYLISVNKNKMLCVLEKISEVLKLRTAIESELIFPHFVYLSEVWSTLVLCFNHLAELNRIKDQIDEHLTCDAQAHYIQLIEDVSAQCIQKPRESTSGYTFGDLIIRMYKFDGTGNFEKAENDTMKEFCALTAALTGGLLLPATIQKTLCENLAMQFGFVDANYAKFAEKDFKLFVNTFRISIYNSIDLMLLLDLTKEVLQQPFEQIEKEIEKDDAEKKYNTCDTQTEFVLTNDLSVSNQINVTWNAWDFYRETIHLAEIRKRQTNSAQSNISYGQRDEQNQTYNTRSHNV